jgi:hypothetical protein
MASVSQVSRVHIRQPPSIAYGSGPIAQHRREMEVAHQKTNGFEPKKIASITWNSEPKILFSPKEIWKHGKAFCKHVVQLIAYQNDENCAQLATDIFNHHVVHGGPAALIILCQSDQPTSEIFPDFCKHPGVYLEMCRRKFILAHERLQANELGISNPYLDPSFSGMQSVPPAAAPFQLVEEEYSNDARRVTSAPSASQKSTMNPESINRRMFSAAEVNLVSS